MPFPNVTSHRRMPHLPNTPKPNSPQVPAAAAQTEQQQPDHGLTTLPTRELENGSSTLRLTATSGAVTARPSGSQKLLQDNSQNAHQIDHNVGLLPASSSSVVASPGRIKDGSDMLDQDRYHTSPGGGVGSPLGSLSLSSATPSASTSPSLTTQDSKMIKTALYDAFGVLYHPSAHTKHSLSTTAAALRSGDVTPLMGLSPKASPLLRPQYLGASAPITPLELSEEASASGYFGLHLPTASSAVSVASPALAGTATANSTAPTVGAGPSSSHHGHHHYHHQHHHHHHHHPHSHRHTHTSSHLSATYTNSETLQEEESSTLLAGRGYRSPLTRSRRTSVDLTLDPTEHPVLSSLQTLSITHPHPPEHYHPHLGHDLGHDRVPIAMDSPASVEQHPSSTMKLTLPTTSSATTSSTATTAAIATTTAASATAPQQQQQQQQQQHRTEHSSSPFPMDRGDRDSISGFGQQDLV
ncbi:hypothetical protein EC991_004229 [Linnemannia zychae]|nr:hypothetical protein EC991_004229 [Linnemannia zychae]